MNDFDPKNYSKDFVWKNLYCPQSEKDPLTGLPRWGRFNVTIPAGKHWNDFWPYSTMDWILCKRSPGGWGYYQINSAFQETTRWDRWRNNALWLITRILRK